MAFLRKLLLGPAHILLTKSHWMVMRNLAPVREPMHASEALYCVSDASACVAKLHQSRLDLPKLNCAA